MPQARYQIYPQEYDCLVRSPFDFRLFSVVTGAPISGAPIVADEGQDNQKGSGSLHHSFQIDMLGNVWAQGDNTCNITGMGLTAATIPFTQTKIGNAKQVIAYANSGDAPNSTVKGLGYGGAIVTNDNKLILLGNTQSGFRGDGTEGNPAEPGPYVVQGITKTIKKAAVGSFIYLLYTDGTVDSWGGTRLQYYPTYCLGRGVDNPDPTRPGGMKFPEAVVDLVGGGSWTLFKGASGTLYGVAYNPRFLGLGPTAVAQNTPFTLTKTLALPDVPIQLAVGPQASYALMPSGDAYAWGDNTQGAIGNGQEAVFSNYVAPWGGGALWVDKPVKINPSGVSFVKIFTSIGDAFYVYYEDTTGTLWNNGRNKGYVLWNGKGGTSQEQSDHPNMWDVLSPTKITGFGPLPPIGSTTPPVPTPPSSSARTVTAATININGMPYAIPIGWLKFTFSDGTTQ